MRRGIACCPQQFEDFVIGEALRPLAEHASTHPLAVAEIVGLRFPPRVRLDADDAFFELGQRL